MIYIKGYINDISKAFNRVWYSGLLHQLKSYGISGQIFGFISFLSNRPVWVVLVESLDTNIQLKLVEFLKSPLLVLHFSYYILITFLMMLCHITKYCDDTTLLSGICSVATTRISL